MIVKEDEVVDAKVGQKNVENEIQEMAPGKEQEVVSGEEELGECFGKPI